MNLLRITLFGCPRIYCCESDQEVRLTRNVQLLLAYLILERHHAHSREILAGLFWRDQSQERAKACLNTALWRLRSALEATIHPEVPYLLNHQPGEICFNAQSSYWLDVESFDQSFDNLHFHATKDAPPDQLKLAEQAEQLYVGELLEGYYDNWVVNERERLRSRYLWILSYLMSAHHQAGTVDASLYYGQRFLQLEPLREDIYREMMRIYAQAGYRAQALAEYETCRLALEGELNIAPMPETQQLYHEILDGTGFKPGELLAKSPVMPSAIQESSLAERIKSVKGKASDQLNHPQHLLRSEQHDLLMHALEKLDRAASLAETTHRQIMSAIDDIEQTVDGLE
jgi:DNA-binding SARP family transcriptional activator